MELTTQEIARVFAMYLGSPYKRFESGEHNDYDYLFVDAAVLVELLSPTYPSHLYERKLLLTPREQIIDEDAIEVAKMCNEDQHDDYLVLRRWNGDIEIRMSNDATSWSFIIHDNFKISQYYVKGYRQHPLPWDCYQFLLLKRYELPIYFAPNHPANGKTAIELGIAIPKQ